MDLYFQRHDGHAVTCDDFANAMEDANGRDLSRLRRWYSQAGTPTLNASWKHDPASDTLTPDAGSVHPGNARPAFQAAGAYSGVSHGGWSAPMASRCR